MISPDETATDCSTGESFFAKVDVFKKQPEHRRRDGRSGTVYLHGDGVGLCFRQRRLQPRGTERAKQKKHNHRER